MFLKRLELFGFKSFADRLDVSFSNGITAIVGPNGSGKSNVSDAVRWVLGEQSAKQMRGTSMADVIFNGTESRKPLNYCEVSLVFDNEDKGLNIEYSEVVITRRLYRSGDCEYYINRQGCRLKDIVTLFQDTGIGKEGYSIIGQGRIDNILSGKSEERRSVFEEAAGIVKYKARKQESERKLANTADNLIRINDILDGLEERIEPLSHQAEVAREYLTQHEKLKGLEVNLFLVQNGLSAQRKADFATQMDGIDQEKAEKTEFISSLALEYTQMEEQNQQNDELLNGIRAKLLELTAGGESATGEQRVFEERMHNLQEQISRVEKEIAENNERKANLQAALNGDGSAEENQKAAIAEKQKEIAAEEESLRVQDAGLAKESEELEKAKAEVLETMNKLSGVKANQGRYEAMQANIEQRNQKIDLALQQLMLQRGSIEDALKDQQGAQDQYNNSKKSIEQKKDVILEKKRLLQEKRDGSGSRLSELEGELQSARSRIRVLEDLKKDYEGFNFSVKRILTRAEGDASIRSHICGVLAELIRTPEKYERAVEAALGGAMQNIVTPTEEDAKALIEFLRTTSSGRATFLPVSAIRAKGLNAQEAAMCRVPGCFGAADGLVTSDERYRNVLSSLLGRTVICEDMNTAISIARKSGHGFRIVTLQGDMINAGGSMTGGSTQTKNSSLLGREREIEQAKEKEAAAAREIASLRELLSGFDKNVAELDAEAMRCDNALHALDVTFARDNEKLNALNSEMRASVEAEEQLTQEKEQLADTMKEIRQELESIAGMQEHMEHSNTDVQSEINRRQSEYNKKRLAREQFAQRITDGKVELAGLTKELDAMHTNKERVQQQIVSLEQAELRLLAQGENFSRQKTEAEEQQKQRASLHAEILQQLEDFTEKEKAASARRDEINAGMKENEGRRHRFEQEIFDASERRHKMELALSKLESDLNYMETRLWDEYELTLAGAEELRDPEFKVNGAQTEINRLKRAISALGTVNVNAIEEYVDVKTKFDELTRQRDDLQKAKADTEAIIEELNRKMDKQFREQFAMINQYFTKTFSKLFGGGKAELKLEEDKSSLEADIEIVAQPPGKSLQLLSLLSGGERALTAIAILFAMLKLKPTPFCILDEIEAALDEANVGNFASYLREYSKDTQFIVITHRKPTMEEADSLYGVAMEEKGVSRIVSVKLT